MLMVAWGSQVSLSGCNQLCTLPMVHCCLSLLQAVCPCRMEQRDLLFGACSAQVGWSGCVQQCCKRSLAVCTKELPTLCSAVTCSRGPGTLLAHTAASNR